MTDKNIIRAVREYRERLLRDEYRPRYHFAFPDGDGRPGDPNGCFYAGGKHHMMYLYRHDSGNFHWGHVSSHDLVHWRHHQDALVAGAKDQGCFSGGAFVDKDGTAYLSYWIFNDEHKTGSRNAGIGLAKSMPPYEKWERLEGPVIPSSEWGIIYLKDEHSNMQPVGCADPSNIWEKDGIYYMLTGNLLVLNKYGRADDSPDNMRGDWAELFSSRDMITWEYRGRFYQRSALNFPTSDSEDNMCPSFLPLPKSQHGGEMSGKHLLLFISHNMGCQYYIGSYTGEKFAPEKHGRMTWIDNSFFAPEAYIDGAGRQLMFAWLLDNMDNDFEQYGWSGVFSLPRTLWLREDGELGIAPADEIKSLRINRQDFGSCMLHGGRKDLPVKNSECCEISIKINMRAAERAGLIVRSGGGEETLIYYDARQRALIFDAENSGSVQRAVRESAPLYLRGDEHLDLTVFIDKAVIEVFANRRQAVCRRVFNKMPGAGGISAFADGDAEIIDATAWEIMPSLEY